MTMATKPKKVEEILPQVPTPQEQGFTGNDQSGRIAGEAQATAEQQPTMGQLQ